MAKTIKSTNKTYEISATVAISNKNGFNVTEFKSDGFESKNTVKIKKYIRDYYKNINTKVLGIENVIATPVITTTVYKFNISNDALIDMLINNDVEFTIVNDDDDSDSENIA